MAGSRGRPKTGQRAARAPRPPAFGPRTCCACFCQHAAPRAQAVASAIFLLQSDVRGAGEAVARMPVLRAPAQSRVAGDGAAHPSHCWMIQEGRRWLSSDPVWTHFGCLLRRRFRHRRASTRAHTRAISRRCRCHGNDGQVRHGISSCGDPAGRSCHRRRCFDARTILRFGGHAVTVDVLLTVPRKRSSEAWSEAVKRQSRVRLPSCKSRPVCLVLLTCENGPKCLRPLPVVHSVPQHVVPFKLAAACAGSLRRLVPAGIA